MGLGHRAGRGLSCAAGHDGVLATRPNHVDLEKLGDAVCKHGVAWSEVPVRHAAKEALVSAREEEKGPHEDRKEGMQFEDGRACQSERSEAKTGPAAAGISSEIQVSAAATTSGCGECGVRDGVRVMWGGTWAGWMQAS